MNQKDNPDNATVDDALKRIDELFGSGEKQEAIPVTQSINRVLYQDVIAQRDIPRFDNSAMDGYLFLTGDLNKGLRRFRIEGEIRPEHEKPAGLKPGNCRQIMTGAPVPGGDYTVVPIEMIDESDVEVDVQGIPDRNPVRRQGEGYKKGRMVLQKGTVIRPYEIGLMIESGNSECSVKKKIRIAIQVTGSEIDGDMNSNGPVLDGLISGWPGTGVEQWPVLDDDPERVLERMKELKKSADIVLTTGGISMGKHDYILGAMEKLGAEVIIRKIQQKPGKPFTLTLLDDTFFFHLPGNPISAVFTAEYYARRAVHNLLGMDYQKLPVIAACDLENQRGGKTLFVPGKLKLDDEGRLTVSSEGVMKSHLMQLYRNCDVYIRLDPETRYTAGDSVEVIPFSTTRMPST